jgi:peroxiredoxin
MILFVKRGPLVILAIGVVVTALLVARLQVARRPRASPASTAPSSLSFSRQMAPDFALESLDGKTVRLSDFRGKTVLLNFWATWCQPCKIEMRWFEQLQKQYGSEGLQVIGIAMDGAGKNEIAEFANNLCVDYLILLGKEDVGDAYGVQLLPATFYIGRNGKVVDKVIGLKDRTEIEDHVKKALGLVR